MLYATSLWNNLNIQIFRRNLFLKLSQKFLRTFNYNANNFIIHLSLYFYRLKVSPAERCDFCQHCFCAKVVAKLYCSFYYKAV